MQLNAVTIKIAYHERDKDNVTIKERALNIVKIQSFVFTILGALFTVCIQVHIHNFDLLNIFIKVLFCLFGLLIQRYKNDPDIVAA